MDGLAKAVFHKSKLREVDLVFDAQTVTRQLQERNLIDLSVVFADDLVNARLEASLANEGRRRNIPQTVLAAKPAPPPLVSPIC